VANAVRLSNAPPKRLKQKQQHPLCLGKRSRRNMNMRTLKKTTRMIMTTPTKTRRGMNTTTKQWPWPRHKPLK
jgi:hypothetical protein